MSPHANTGVTRTVIMPPSRQRYTPGCCRYSHTLYTDIAPAPAVFLLATSFHEYGHPHTAYHRQRHETTMGGGVVTRKPAGRYSMGAGSPATQAGWGYWVSRRQALSYGIGFHIIAPLLMPFFSPFRQLLFLPSLVEYHPLYIRRSSQVVWEAWLDIGFTELIELNTPKVCRPSFIRYGCLTFP